MIKNFINKIFKRKRISTLCRYCIRDKWNKELTVWGVHSQCAFCEDVKRQYHESECSNCLCPKNICKKGLVVILKTIEEKYNIHDWSNHLNKPLNITMLYYVQQEFLKHMNKYDKGLINQYLIRKDEL